MQTLCTFCTLDRSDVLLSDDYDYKLHTLFVVSNYICCFTDCVLVRSDFNAEFGICSTNYSARRQTGPELRHSDTSFALDVYWLNSFSATQVICNM